jgi:hypothetical protein
MRCDELAKGKSADIFEVAEPAGPKGSVSDRCRSNANRFSIASPATVHSLLLSASATPWWKTQLKILRATGRPV